MAAAIPRPEGDMKLGVLPAAADVRVGPSTPAAGVVEWSLGVEPRNRGIAEREKIHGHI